MNTDSIYQVLADIMIIFFVLGTALLAGAGLVRLMNALAGALQLS